MRGSRTILRTPEAQHHHDREGKQEPGHQRTQKRRQHKDCIKDSHVRLPMEAPCSTISRWAGVPGSTVSHHRPPRRAGPTRHESAGRRALGSRIGYQVRYELTKAEGFYGQVSNLGALAQD
jgi:hypothetical protein